jgi:hypothetical protein
VVGLNAVVEKNTMSPATAGRKTPLVVAGAVRFGQVD